MGKRSHGVDLAEDGRRRLAGGVPRSLGQAAALGQGGASG